VDSSAVAAKHKDVPGRQLCEAADHPALPCISRTTCNAQVRP
jgi:hypothetical protein